MRIPKALFVVLAGVLLLALVAGAGSLTPSALPAATMHSLANIYDSIASAAFDSSAIVANQNGSLLGNLKYIENQIVWASGSNNIWNLNAGNVGIGTITPTTKLDVVGAASVSGNLEVSGKIILPATTDSSTGVIELGGFAFLHGYNDNTFLGLSAGNFSMTGTYNTAVGSYALADNTTGQMNSAFGYIALQLNTTGSSNTASGRQSLSHNMEGDNNSAYGYLSLYNNQSGDANTAVGVQALQANVTGASNSVDGYQSSYSNVTGNGNSIYGAQAGFGSGSVSDFSNTVLMGYRAGYSLLTAGDNNILLGYQAGDALTTGNTNIVIGYNIDAPTPTSTQTLNIGNLIFGTGLDGTGTTLSTGNVGIGTLTPTTKFELVGTASVSALLVNGVPITGGSGVTSNSLDFDEFVTNMTVDVPTTINSDLGLSFTKASVSNVFEVSGYASLSSTLWVSPPGYEGNVGIGTKKPIDLLSVRSFDGDGTATISFNFGTSGFYLNLDDPNDNLSGTAVTMMNNSPGAVAQLIHGVANDGLVLALIQESAGDFIQMSNTGGEVVRINNAGGGYFLDNVGIGATTPEQKLEVKGNILASASANAQLILNSIGTGTNDGKFSILSSGATGVDSLLVRNGAGASLMTIASSGYVGIGTTAPARMLHIGSTAVVDATALLRLEDANSTCDFTANAGSPTCGSDLRLKKEIVGLTDGILDKLIALDVVNYHWKTDDASASLQTGFIAQNVQASFPSLVATASWVDGKPALFLSQNGLIPYMVKGIQELASKDLLIDELLRPTTDNRQPTTDNLQRTTNSGPLARLVRNILAYIAEAFGFIVEKGKIQSEKVCIGAECIDEQELQQIRQLIHGRTAEPAQTPASTQVVEELQPSSTPAETPIETPTPSDTPSPTPEEPAPTATP